MIKEALNCRQSARAYPKKLAYMLPIMLVMLYMTSIGIAALAKVISSVKRPTIYALKTNIKAEKIVAKKMPCRKVNFAYRLAILTCPAPIWCATSTVAAIVLPLFFAYKM